jgi:hypothetical protein
MAIVQRGLRISCKPGEFRRNRQSPSSVAGDKAEEERVTAVTAVRRQRGDRAD